MTPAAVTVTRHESELGRWEMAHRAPNPLLANHVLRMTGYVERTNAPLSRLEAPFEGIVLILSFDERLRLVDAGGRDELHTSFAAGLSDGPTYTEHAGIQHGIQVDLTPPAARALLGLPLRELTNRVVPLEDVLGPNARRLIDRLYELPSWEGRFRLLDQALGRRLEAARPVPPAVVAAWSRLRASHGRAEIAALAGELGYSRRRLSARFADEFGLPPKTFARILRFGRAAARLSNDDGARFAEIAQDCGYYDQAHLNRDFREFAGTSPSSYVGRLLPDGGGVSASEDVPFVQDAVASAA
ncbi:MAG TPA: helix-turn-helix domain-containing protein [Thermoleophilaceae bacterium]|jgi:AraC-like DNA-binding protein